MLLSSNFHPYQMCPTAKQPAEGADAPARPKAARALSRKRGAAFPVAVLMAGLGHSELALAYCRATTCESLPEQACATDSQQCPTEGLPLFWPDLCVSFSVSERGAPQRGIDANAAESALAAAFTRWISADCEGRPPSIAVGSLGVVRCDRAEFAGPEDGRGGGPNANILIFQQDAWPYVDSGGALTVARTTLSFDPASGAILDADIEVNARDFALGLGSEPEGANLGAVLTHETGHFLGLAHSSVPGATMHGDYALDDLGVRTLADDDRAGICAIYPPGETPIEQCLGSSGPNYGFSRDCAGDTAAATGGCSALGGTISPGSWQLPGALGLPLLALGAARRRYRRRRRRTAPNSRPE